MRQTRPDKAGRVNTFDLGVCVPNYRPGASPEAMVAATETATLLGWESVWTTDHLLPDRGPKSRDYEHLYEAATTLAWLGGRFDAVRLGLSVLVVPMRNAVVLAKELATIDALVGGRLVAGVGIGWNEQEFRNVGVAHRFRHRGAYLEETIALWRHLWSGSELPFEGRFHSFDEIHFSPLPAQGANVPIWIGGRVDAAVARAGRIADGYQSSQASPDTMVHRARIIRESASAAGRPTPLISSRVRVRFGPPDPSGYTLAGTPEMMRDDILAFLAAGVSHLVVDFAETRPETLVAAMERFDRDVARTFDGDGSRPAT
jgi:probable F420-dependent oxidoreductase